MTMRVAGQRAELIARLLEQAEGWYHLGKDALFHAASLAVNELEQGADAVRVGHTEYHVTET